MNIFSKEEFHGNYVTNAYEYLGSFYKESETVFRVYAPNAESVSVVGDFNDWNDSVNLMKLVDKGIWEAIIPNVKIYDNYKYAIVNKKTKKKVLKQDPYAHHFETNGASSSKVYSVENYIWNDQEWMNNRNHKEIYKSPVNIYEVQIGSWKKHSKGYDLNYRDIAVKLCAYVKKMGYNYVEFLPVMEHPFLGSWGYQVTGYFSVTSRYGIPDDFMYLIDYLHQNEIGIILDWVPAHFPKDDFSLCEFDGDYVYEDPRPTRMEHKTWGTRIFNYSKPEIKSFLLSSADFFFNKFHIDGLRVDAVAAMIYLDYDRKEWIPNIYGGNYNLEAIDFLKTLNEQMFKKYNNILMIAEESTAFPMVTHPVNLGGLGFNYKWNMGWMNDSLDYMKTDPYFKKSVHHKMTFAMSYAFSENFILPISHDEVVHGKKSLLDKMPGGYDDKFSNLRTYMMYMMTHPGKKLLFMGCEFGQFIEWDEKKELDWFLLKYPKHSQLQKYVKDINHLYLKSPQLFEIENSWDGFEWIHANDENNNAYVYLRKSREKKDMLVILNFSGSILNNYQINHHNIRGTYKIIMDSDDFMYGGLGRVEVKEVKAIKGKLTLNIPPLTGIILQKKY